MDDAGKRVILSFDDDDLPERVTAGTIDTSVVSIDDNDVEPELSIADATLEEADADLQLTVSLHNAAAPELGSGRPVTVAYAVTAATAEAGTDYTPVAAGTLAFSPGETGKTIAVTVLEDDLNEADETFTVTLSAPADTATPLHATLTDATATATATITDDDALTAAVTAATPAVTEGDQAPFPVALTGGTSTAPVAVTYTIGGSATPGDDYTVPSGTLTLAAGAASGTIVILTTPDEVLDPSETLVVTLSAARTAGTATVDPAAAAATIANEGTETVVGEAIATLKPTTATEGAPAQFEVSLSGEVTDEVTLSWTTAAGTATAGADYTETSGTLRFAPGEGPAPNIVVETVHDTYAESAETFTVTLGTASAVGTIADDDMLTATVSGVEAVVEGAVASFPVALTGGTSTAPVAVTYTISGSATPGDDYTVPSGMLTLTLAAGAASGTISIETLDDRVLDPNETLEVTLSGASTTAGSAEADTTTVQTTILDQGMVTVSVAATAGSTVNEGETASFTVTLTGAVASAVELGWTTGATGDTAVAAADYTAVTDGTLTFLPADLPSPLSPSSLSRRRRRSR